MTFRFRNRFWENLSSEKPVSFLHAGPEHFFPTWWSAMPLRSNDLVAWQGGPVAMAMASWKQEKKIQAAFQTLSELSGRSISFLEANCLSCHAHDWSADPFSLGAYSYIKKEGLASARQILKPAQDTIYFAGEGTCFDSTRGTVEGALNSGVLVGKALVRSLLKEKAGTSPWRSPSHSNADFHLS